MNAPQPQIAQAQGLRPHRRPRPTPLALACLGVLVLYWLVAAAVLLIDPYDVYPWGARPKLDPHDVSQSNKYLVSAVARSGAYDLLMIGSSTAMPYSPDDLRKAFPNAERPMNFSYDGVRPKDRDVVLRMVARHARAKRVAIWIDWTYATFDNGEVEDFPDYLYDGPWYNDLRMVNIKGVEAAWSTWREGGPFPDGPDQLAHRRSVLSQTYDDYQSPRSMRRLAAEAARPPSATAPARPCRSFETLNAQLLPSLRALTAKGVAVDLIIPAYSVVFFRERSGAEEVARRGGSAGDMLAFRRCLAISAEGMPQVRIWALDKDTAMITDLANYKDAGHLYPPDMLARSLGHIGDPAFLLTADNVDGYVAGMEALIRNYRFANSNFAEGNGS